VAPPLEEVAECVEDDDDDIPEPLPDPA